MVGEHKPRLFPQCNCGIPAIAHRPSHTPLAWPVCTCGARSENHRVKHHYEGRDETCAKCGLAEERHIGSGPSHRTPYRYQFVGIDGEGIGRKPHRYVMLCAATTEGQQWSIADPKGLSSVQALGWLVDTLSDCRVFAYGFGYDITCLIRDLPDAAIYDLLRPSRRYSKGKLRPVQWRGFELDWLQGKFTVRRGAKRVAIWDLVKFYQQSFVKSLQDWAIDTEGIEAMKDRRSTFTRRDMPKMKDYCLTECRQLADLAQKLLQAHTAAGFTLRSYYGPGSTASVLLSQMRVLDYVKPYPARMTIPVACAFFGGRFEHSDIGIVKPVYAYDISNAYPYQAYQLPCLKHGKWSHIDRSALASTVERGLTFGNCTTALIHYSYHGSPCDAWAPFPHRSAKGAICYPYRTQGWTWLPEYRAARRMGRIEVIEAWVYRTACDCRPFAALADYYRRRVEIGKDARGKPFKLGPNSVYGKLAQSKGPNPKYQNWIWAGLITSGTRAQLFEAMRTAPDPTDIVAVATDGVFSRVPLNLATPVDTGTFDLAEPLGGWEETVYEGGMLFIKPGIYLTLDGDATIKARGVGRKALATDRKRVIAAYRAGATKWTVTVDRFHGAKTSITPRGRRPSFGQWSRMPIRIAFECPNRNAKMGLLARDTASVPYDASLVTPETLQLHEQEDITYEQP